MNLLFKGLFGSHLYGLDTPDSDKDYKGIYMPEGKDIVLGRVKETISRTTGKNDSKNTSEDVDFEVFSLQQFVKLACQGQTCAIDMLHTPETMVLESSPEWSFLVSNRKKFYSKNMNAFMGYVKKQAAKYGIKGSKIAVLEEILKITNEDYLQETQDLPLSEVIDKLPLTDYTYIHNTVLNEGTPKELVQTFYVVNGSKMHDIISIRDFRKRVQKQMDNYGARAKLAKDNSGVDWKALSHALRAGYQLRDIFLHGDFDYPLKETAFLLDVKQGKLDYLSEVSPILESLVDELDDLSELSSLPEVVDTEFWDDWVYDKYSKSIL